jgi:sodium/hydrogen exchanger 8
MVMSLWLYMLSPYYSFTPSLLELMAFSALISATDPVSTLAVFSEKKVDPHLFYLVFGDSSVNDAVSLVLFDSLSHLIESNITNVGSEIAQFLFDFSTGFIGSIVLGVAIGLGYALFLKTFDFRHLPLFELGVFSTVIYFPFVIAEIMHLSGIVTVLMTGIVAKRYAEPNLSVDTARSADVIFRLLAHITETIIFLELGLSVASVVGLNGFRASFLLASVFGCLIGRAANVYPITLVYNFCKSRVNIASESFLSEAYTKQADNITHVVTDQRTIVHSSEKALDDTIISWNKAHMLWFAGLRGAVSYGLVRMFPATENKSIFVATTMIIVLITTFVLGGTTEFALRVFNIDVGVDEKQYMASVSSEKLLVGRISRFEKTTLRRWVVRDDNHTKHYKDVEGEYMEHIEMTTREHDRIVGRQARPESVYDYGQ